MMKKILVTGGGGYVGAVLVPKLLRDGHQVKVLDLFIYGEDVFSREDKQNPRLQIIKGDIRDQILLKKSLRDTDTVVHLACISNDPSFDLDPDLGRSINLDAFRPLVEISKANGVDRFIYASSSSVYGVKEEQNVHEGMELTPLTDYSRFKADCEKILLEYQSDDFTTVIIRPATVCGYSPRQRLDVVVNILTNYAYHKRSITVFGGDQLRPNIHIEDMTNLYIKLVNLPKEKVAGKIYNAGYENFSVNDLAKMVMKVIGEDVKIVRAPSDDPRSYHISSDKIAKDLGFFPEFTIEQAVQGLREAFEKGLLPKSFEDKKYFNIKAMKEISLR